MKRVAPEDPLEGQPAPFPRSVLLDRLETVVRAGGVETAALSYEGEDRCLIETNQKSHENNDAQV